MRDKTRPACIARVRRSGEAVGAFVGLGQFERAAQRRPRTRPLTQGLVPGSIRLRGVARVEPTDRRMIDVVGRRDLAQLRPATRRATARAVSSFAASRRGLAFERAHFSPDPLNGGSPDADGRSRLVNARATPQKSLDRPFRLGVDPRPPNRFAALGALAAALRMPAITRPESRLASCLAMVASTASRIPRTISLSAQRCGSV